MNPDLFAQRARLPEYRRLLVATERVIARALDVIQSGYVAFSAGKDSTVLLHLARAQAPDLPAVYVDDEWRLPETDALLDTTPDLRRVAKTGYYTEWFSSWQGHRPDNAEWVGDTYRPDWARVVLGYDGCFLGLRADEAVRRRQYLRRDGQLHFNQRRNAWQCCPLAYWSVMDIWTYIHSNSVPYNAAYDVLTRVGIPLDEQRIGPFAVERVLGYGQLAILKRGWPELFNRFAEQHPEARAYT